jgi:hypothetical protein
MMTEMGEPIKVGVVFDPERSLIPKWFSWNGRRHEIQRITFNWKVRDGQRMFHHFAVTDGTNLYELTYDASALSWKLMAVSTM